MAKARMVHGKHLDEAKARIAELEREREEWRTDAMGHAAAAECAEAKLAAARKAWADVRPFVGWAGSYPEKIEALNAALSVSEAPAEGSLSQARKEADAVSEAHGHPIARSLERERAADAPARKPTIHELEEILEEPDQKVSLMPDGSVRVLADAILEGLKRDSNFTVELPAEPLTTGTPAEAKQLVHACEEGMRMALRAAAKELGVLFNDELHRLGRWPTETTTSAAVLQLAENLDRVRELGWEE